MNERNLNLKSSLTGAKLCESENMLFHTIFDQVSKTDDLNSAMQVVLQRICEFSGWDIGKAWLPHHLHGVEKYTLAAIYSGLEEVQILSEYKHSTLLLYTGLLDRVFSTKQPVWIEKIQDEKDLNQTSLIKELGVRTAVGFPVMGNENQVLAIINFFKVEQQEEDKTLIDIISVILRMMSYIILQKQTVERLKESEKQFQTMADCTPVLIGTSDMEGKGVYFNKVWLQFTGRSVEQEKGLGWLQSFYPDDLTSVWQIYSEAVKNIRSFEAQFRLKRNDGEYRWMWAKGAPRLTEEGEFVGMIASCIDIHDQKKVFEENLKLTSELEQRIEARTRQLETVNKELEAFSYSVSHDLRAPLRAIDGFSQIVLEKYNDMLDERGKYYLSRVRVNSQEMAKLIDDILQLSRLTRGEMKFEGNINLSAMAHEIASDLQQESPDRQVTFNIEEDLICEGDRVLLKSVLQNLISNSWKFTSKHPNAVIEFGQLKDHENQIFFVKDDGAGFDMAYAGKLFGAFQRLHSAADFPGTGVGLATVARIIHRHNGEVWAEAEVEKGATFYFTLHATKDGKHYE